MILLDAGQHVLSRRIMAGAKRRNPGIRCIGSGEAGTHLLDAGTDYENERDVRAGTGLTISAFPANYSSSVNPTRKVTW